MNLPADLARSIDHTLLRANAGEADIRQLCAEATLHDFYAVCVNPRWVAFCSGELFASRSIPITVVGFPLGANNAEVKKRECEIALRDGAREIDMVIDLQNALAHDWKKVEDEIKIIAAECGRVPLKVILETAYLAPNEIVEACKCCVFAGAAFVKSSTGFAPSGAKEEDIRLMRETVGPVMGVKASGGIRTYSDAVTMLRAGANRLGSSNSVAILSEAKKEQSA